MLVSWTSYSSYARLIALLYKLLGNRTNNYFRTRPYRKFSSGVTGNSAAVCTYGISALEAPIGGVFKLWFRSVAKVQAAAEFPVTPAITKIFARPNFLVMLHVRQQKIFTNKYTAL